MFQPTSTRIDAIVQRAIQLLPRHPSGIMMFGAKEAATYVEQHTGPSTGQDDEGACLLGTATLEWLLRDGRKQLRGMFDEPDFLALMDCFERQMFVNEMWQNFVGMLCDDWGEVAADYDDAINDPPTELLEDPREDFPGLGNLLLTLARLTPLQAMALGDAIEQAWHRGYANNMMPREFLATIGIELRDPSPMD